MNILIVKDQILEYMRSECSGVGNAKSADTICKDLVLEDRMFRKLFSELKESGLVASTPADGRFAIPARALSESDKNAIRHSINDLKSRAIKQLKSAKKMADRLGEKLIMEEGGDLFGLDKS